MVTAGSAALANTSEEPQAAPLHETVSGVEQNPAPVESEPEPAPDYAYMLREYEGRVAVFTADNPAEPEMVLDTLVKYLPDYDRSQMQEGIKVKDYQQLVSLIEDFAS